MERYQRGQYLKPSLLDGGVTDKKHSWQAVIQKPALIKNQCSELDRFTDVANSLLARDYKGFGNQPMNGVIEDVE